MFSFYAWIFSRWDLDPTVDLIFVPGLSSVGVLEDRGEGRRKRAEGSDSDGQHPGCRTPLMTLLFIYLLIRFYFFFSFLLRTFFE